jgi:hypothetical protein
MHHGLLRPNALQKFPEASLTHAQLAGRPTLRQLLLFHFSRTTEAFVAATAGKGSKRGINKS